MKLTTAECNRFFRTWFSLLIYTNRKHTIVPDLKEPSNPRKLRISPELAVQIRDVVWEEDNILAEFAAANPHKLAPGDLKLALSWQTRRSGTFFIFRHLKKYTIFLDEKGKAYGVLGLLDSFEDMVGSHLPVMAQTTLLPFEDKITYDGLLAGYPVHFGSGIREDLNYQYQDCQELGGVITRLGELDPEEVAQRTAASNIRVLKAFQKYLRQKGYSPDTVDRHIEALTLYGESFRPQQFIREPTLDEVREFLDVWLPQHSPKNFKSRRSASNILCVFCGIRCVWNGRWRIGY